MVISLKKPIATIQKVLPHLAMNLNYHVLTDIGKRQQNEDYHLELINPDWALFAVTDGLGGHPGGEKAAPARVRAGPAKRTPGC